MASAAEAVFDVPHPEEPEDPLPNYVSPVEQTAEGHSFWIDAKDELDDPGVAQQVLESITDALTAAGVDGELSVVADQPP